MKHRFVVVNDDYDRKALYANGKLVKVAGNISPNDILDFLNVKIGVSYCHDDMTAFPEYLKDVNLEKE
jgi:hypothetical protein